MSAQKREYLTVKDPQALADAFENGSLKPMCTLGKVSRDKDDGPCVFYDLEVYDPIALKKKSVNFHLPKCFNDSMEECEDDRGKQKILCDTSGAERREYITKIERCLRYFKEDIKSKHDTPDQTITVTDYITEHDDVMLNFPWTNKDFNDFLIERSMRQGQFILMLGSGYLTRSTGKVGANLVLGSFLHSTASRVLKKRKVQEPEEVEEASEEVKETE
jgi:hypothetical protein